MKTPFSVEDLYLHKKITDLAYSPDGSQAVATVRSVDIKNNDYIYTLWKFFLNGKPPVQVLSPSASGQKPRWNLDGTHLAFISSASGTPQPYLLQREDGEPWKVGEMPGGITDLQWFPNGQTLGVLSGVTVDPDLRGARPQGTHSGGSRVEVAWKLPYKADGVGYLLQREIHLFKLDVKTGEYIQLTDGAFDVLGFAIAPDGKSIAYSRTRSGRFAHCTELWLCNIDGSNHRPAVQDMAIVGQPFWSPNSLRVAFAGAIREGEGQSTLWVYEVRSQARGLFLKDAVEVADATSLFWEDDSQSLVFSEAYRGRHRLVLATAGTDSPIVLVEGDRQFGAFGYSHGALLFSVESPIQPSELHCLQPGDAEQCISALNPWWHERTKLRAEILSFDVPDGDGGTEQIEGWLIQSDATQGASPLLNDVHGGPASYALMDFDTNVYWQILCSSGWSVLALNAVGSSSYGRRFCDRLQGRWGEMDLPQHLAAIAQLQANGVCSDRVAVSGKSYGGFLSAWTIGHSHLFRAAVVMAPVGNIETHYGTSDGGYYADPFYLGSVPRLDRQLARKLSPLQYVEQAKTPTLFLQGKDDERCPKCQSEEMFVSLMRAGNTPTELVLYPEEGHSFLGEGKPACRTDAARRIVEWLEKHTRDALETCSDQKLEPIPMEADEAALDNGVEESFPASDPVSVSITKI